jgi:GNAT superfamily N-acetyltransferase
MNIRSVISSDFSAWLPLWEEYNSFYRRSISSEITKKSWERFLDPAEPMHALVAEQDGRLIGFVHFLYHRSTSMMNDNCYLQDLFTLESERGHGVGKALILSVYEKAKEQGSTRVYWLTNDVARSLYDKVADYSGFVVYRKIFAK